MIGIATNPKQAQGRAMEGRSRACAPDPPLDPDVQDYCIRLPNHGFASRVDVVWALPTKKTDGDTIADPLAEFRYPRSFR